jgi:hypothetical protein
MNIINDLRNNYEIIISKYGMHIINYTKILDISGIMIVIKFFDKSIKISGSSLIIKKLDENELIIDGIIKGIEFISE